MHGADPAAVKPSDSFELWHEATCRNYSTTDCKLTSDAHFGARIEVKSFGPLLVSDMVCSTVPDEPLHVSRHGAHIRKDARDDIMLWLTLEGSATIAQDGRAAQMRPGDLVLHDQTQPFELEFRENHCAIMVTIPRPLLISRMPTARRCVARRIAAGTPVGALAASMIGQISRMAATTDPDVALRIGASALDILATTIEAELKDTSTPMPHRARQLEQVKRYLMANLDDADLDIARIASSQNMAPRTLNRLFAAEGTTPIRWLWRQRLAASYKALAEGHITQVIDAALSFGFSDPSHFSRAFKAAFGQTPHAVARDPSRTAAREICESDPAPGRTRSN